MDVYQLCNALKQRVTVELQEAVDPAEKGEILVAALYELSRSVLPELGAPKTSRAYHDGQGAVLDLITFIAIPLIRVGVQQQRGVAVLSEIAEGCLDPLLKKKLAVYAQELLAKSKNREVRHCGPQGRPWFPWLAGSVAAAVLAVYFSWQSVGPGAKPKVLTVAAAPQAAPVAPAAPQAPVCTPPVERAAGDAAGARERSEEEARKADRPAADGGAAAAQRVAQLQGAASSQGEQTTRVRIVNNQVLVPVTLKNGGATVRVELVLDTGATRTAIHEGITGRLPIDLRLARNSQAIVADGRVIRSRIAKVDFLGVGPFAMASLEVELIPYHGSEGMHDGLLGMDFLGKHRYQIDMEHELIRWF
ncbi:MAG: hypothetical protein A2075_15755 [Geobacteraceae bacterium GWC2_58_44]|nr:MAG: hypothetical protein A2075_15755 [Geobacteraceae bacterium GWC2_58_44]HBG05374.1 peptidase [Geobacter sp.]